MTVQYAELREKIGNGSFELSDLDDLRNTASNGKERAAIAAFVAKFKAKKVDAYDLEVLAEAYPEKKSEKRVEKLSEPTALPPAPRPTAEARQNPVRDDAPGSK